MTGVSHANRFEPFATFLPLTRSPIVDIALKNSDLCRKPDHESTQHDDASMQIDTDDRDRNDPALQQPHFTNPSESGKAALEDARKSSHTTVTGTVNTGDISTKAKDVTAQVLDFLSNASNETLGACVVALGATTWLVLGRVGLILIGAVGGVVLHATWEGNGPDHASDEARGLEAKRRREKGLDVASRVLDWRERTKKEVQTEDVPSNSQKILDFSGFRPETSAALTNLTEAVVQNYVKWWYGPVLPKDETFPAACRQTLTNFLIATSSQLSRKRPADTFLDFLTNSSSIIIVFLSELSAALKSSSSSNDALESVNEFLEENPTSSLANILDVQQQQGKLEAVAREILRSHVESKTYACEPVQIFLRQILANVVLEMTVTSCSRAEFINDWIIYSLEEGNTELLGAFDAGVGGATGNGNAEKLALQINGTSTGTDDKQQSSESQSSIEHKRTVSRAENAMEEAMLEAKRLSELIAAEEAKKQRSTDQSSSSEESVAGEATPTSSRDELSGIGEDSGEPLPGGNAVLTDKASEPVASFTTFDQIISSRQPTALQSSLSSIAPPLTLYNANISIFDDSVPNEKGSLRSKPTGEYILQVEPASSQYPGWMISRLYSDFETLHEVLRRISVVSGVAAFAERHQAVPPWKNQTKAKLRSDLEHYLRDALSFQRLAESEGMKRFLEKDQGIGQSSPGTAKGGFGFPSPAAFETMGKGMLDVLSSAPKGAAGGGKAILGGVSGVFGVGSKRQPSKSPAGRATDGTSLPSVAGRSSTDFDSSIRSSGAFGRRSQESVRTSLNIQENEKPPPLPRRKSQAPSLSGIDESPTTNGKPTLPHMPSSNVPEDQTLTQNELHLPPPPSEITDDYKQSPASQMPPPNNDASTSDHQSEDKATMPPLPIRHEAAPLNSQETSVAVELFFAIINELYTLSSAWTLRLTLLNAAKSFLLRPGNPNLEAIRVLIQSTVIDANTTDAGIASHLSKIRENALPTEEELKAWPPPPSEEEKERKRQKARKLLVEKGMPQALTSVMGAAASGEALGRVFDCLQVPEVARGLVFALVLQGVRALTQ